MKTYLLAGFALLLACCYVGNAFAADSGGRRSGNVGIP